MLRDLAGRLSIALDSLHQHTLAQRAIRVRDDVLATVSHDLRSPLSTVFASAELLLRMDAVRLSAPARPRVAAMVRAAKQMQRLIDDLLDATSVEAGKIVLDKRRCSATELIAESVEQFADAAEEHGIRLTASLPDEPIEVDCDPLRVAQVLSNLIGNALKFTRRGGAVVAGVERRGEEVYFSVTDSGIGIGREQLPHLFDRFYRKHWGTLPGESRPGAGLGLYIVKGLVEAHGGNAWVESRLGAGTKAYFTLLAAAPRKAA